MKSSHGKISAKQPVTPPPESFRRRIERWFDSSIFLDPSMLQLTDWLPVQRWKKKFLDDQGLKDLWEIEQTKIIKKEGARRVEIKRYNVKPERILECLCDDYLASFDLPEASRGKFSSLPKALRAALQLTSKKKRKRAAAHLIRSAGFIEKYAVILKLHFGTDHGGKDLADLVRNFGARISRLRSSRGRRPESFVRWAGIEVMNLLHDNHYDPPWALGGRLMYDAFAPDLWSPTRARAGDALKELIRDDFISFQQDIMTGTTKILTSSGDELEAKHFKILTKNRPEAQASGGRRLSEEELRADLNNLLSRMKTEEWLAKAQRKIPRNKSSKFTRRKRVRVA